MSLSSSPLPLVDPTPIPYRDNVFIDTDILDRMQNTLGLVGADQAITAGYEMILDRLAEMRRLSRSGDMPAVALRSGAVGILARTISMVTPGVVADDVHACALQGETVALSATLDRLQRVVDRSVMMLWGL